MSDARDELNRLFAQTAMGRWMAETELPPSFDASTVAIAHTQANRLAAMFSPINDDGTPKDPRTVMEDSVTAWIDGASEEAQATMVYALNRRGWSLDRAQQVRDRMNRRR